MTRQDYKLLAEAIKSIDICAVVETGDLEESREVIANYIGDYLSARCDDFNMQKFVEACVP